MGKKKSLDFVFIDLDKAYDKVPMEVLWRYLKARGVLVTYIRVVKEMYDGVDTDRSKRLKALSSCDGAAP